MKILKMGVVGVGRIGRMHVENINKRVDGLEVIAVSDLPDSLQAQSEFLDKMNVQYRYADYRELVKNPQIDAVLIACPSNMHYEVCLSAAAAKKHVFCEKPLESDVWKCQEMIEACRIAGVKLQVGFNRRFDHNFRRIKDLIDAGELGDIQLVRITSRDPAPPPIEYIQKSGGIFKDMTIHDFDMVRYLTSQEMTEVYATGDALINPEIAKAGDIDTAICTFRLGNGAIGTIDNSRKAVYGYDQRVEVFGSKGQAQAFNDKPTTVKISTQQGEVADKICYFFIERYTQSFIDEIDAFVQCIMQDTKPLANGEDGLQVLKIAMAATQSLHTSVPVAIK